MNRWMSGYIDGWLGEWMGSQLCSCVEGSSLLVPWKGLFLNRWNVYVALLHIRNVGSSGVVAGSSLSRFPGAPG